MLQLYGMCKKTPTDPQWQEIEAHFKGHETTCSKAFVENAFLFCPYYITNNRTCSVIKFCHFTILGKVFYKLVLHLFSIEMSFGWTTLRGQ